MGRACCVRKGRLSACGSWWRVRQPTGLGLGGAGFLCFDHGLRIRGLVGMTAVVAMAPLPTKVEKAKLAGRREVKTHAALSMGCAGRSAATPSGVPRAERVT